MTPASHDTQARFEALFQGLPEAFGTGRGEWVKRPPQREDFRAHLAGVGPGLGIAPLRRDGTCTWAAIDLDEPDFKAAEAMMEFIPGPSYIERSRSGNAHILVFFDEPIEAWIARGILKEVILAAGKAHVEVFPKADRLMPGMLGSYLNLPYYGDTRPVISNSYEARTGPMTLEEFVEEATAERNSPDAWRKRARWLQISSPDERARERSEFGTQPYLHPCIEHIIASRDENPVTAGHRNVVYFNVAKATLNTSGYDDDDALFFLRLLNDASPDPVQDHELVRLVANAHRGRWTSTGCDDPLMSPYVLDSCPVLKNG